jgi:glycosyltransferase involved in cell wall biosynthesis
VRILIHSNAPGNAAYGRQAAIWAKALPQLGHETAISAFAGLSGGRQEIDGITVYPGGIQMYGGDVLAGHAQDFSADLVIVLMDAWALGREALKSAGAPAACWLPVDCSPLSLMDVNTLQGSGAGVIAISRHGQRELKGAGLDAPYVPHGIDTAVFAPQDKAAAREALGVPEDAFVIGMNAANLDGVRKGFGEQFAAFSVFAREHPEALLMVHTLADRRGQGGLDLNVMAARVIPAGVTWFADPYRYISGGYSDADMAQWYACLDVYSGASWAEGFGIPLIEAQACGIPVVTTRASAMTENCGCGWLVDGDQWWNASHAAWWSKPRIELIAEAYERAYGGEGEPEKAREFAERFDIQRVLHEHWKPALEAIEAAL